MLVENHYFTKMEENQRVDSGSGQVVGFQESSQISRVITILKVHGPEPDSQLFQLRSICYLNCHEHLDFFS
jgi:hypothetical protein